MPANKIMITIHGGGKRGGFGGRGGGGKRGGFGGRGVGGGRGDGDAGGKGFMGLTRKQQVGVADLLSHSLPLTPDQKELVKKLLGPAASRPAVPAAEAVAEQPPQQLVTMHLGPAASRPAVPAAEAVAEPPQQEAEQDRQAAERQQRLLRRMKQQRLYRRMKAERQHQQRLLSAAVKRGIKEGMLAISQQGQQERDNVDEDDDDEEQEGQQKKDEIQ